MSLPALSAPPGVDLAPLGELLLLAAVLALLPLGLWAWRHRRAPLRVRLAALTTLTRFLTLDLIVFGAFTRLTDSGLGCPDWPGCYGEASPWAAGRAIAEAQAALPSGPVTWAKAWIEMVHRYLAMTVGALILAMALLATWARRELPHALAWPWLTLVWVLVQGLLGKFTVTLKLYPAVVTGHLLGAMGLLALLVLQWHAWRAPAPLTAGPRLRRLAAVALGLVVVQVALGGWVSTNYAVLACRGFPQCNGQWWPQGMDFGHGFTLLRALGRAADGAYLPAGALLAIHWVHRLMALAVTLVLLALVRRLAAEAGAPGRRWALALSAALAWQLASGLGNVVLNWPLAGALAHSAGAAALCGLLTALGLRLRPKTEASRPASAPAGDTPRFLTLVKKGC